ncbi:phage portal protein [Marinobacter sp. KMM 10035]|uniref:phage portal protein n=1 Tax=Marinobacter sp. KMM 10035 TaxID=3134034 RepID=UPI00397A79C6
MSKNTPTAANRVVSRITPLADRIASQLAPVADRIIHRISPVPDGLVMWLNPEAGLRRQKARQIHNLQSSYEAAKPDRTRKFRRDTGGPNVQTQQGAVAIRNQARHLEQNHDIARGILRTLTTNIVGPKGIGIEPQPRTKDGKIHKDYAAALLEAWRDWQTKPDVTGQYHWARIQRMLVKTWLRDGESFAQLLTGPVPLLDHGTRIPFSLEIFEPDMVPFSLNDTRLGVRQGIELNAWGKPRAYWVHKQHPTDGIVMMSSNNVKRIAAEKILHITSTDRIGQIRGVSEFASVITRLEDIKDYEESERVAAKISAMLTAYVKRGNPEMLDPDTLPRDSEGNISPREISMQPGTIVDTLEVGEEIGLIDSKRPNPNLITFRQGQLKALAAGVGASYSTIARDYNGTFSAQRQELIEQWGNYATLTDEFVGNIVQPVWEAFVRAADLSGVVPMPKGLKEGTADDALFIGQSMPWIDPLKEANAWSVLVRAGFASESEVMRKRGVNPIDVLDQVQKFREESVERGLVFDSNAAWKLAVDKELNENDDEPNS